ncbi:hypothetical protein ACHHYP_05468 [Achlya hypogyna]|uniref:Uncharacterized protein n=1 Tax=Achlya hypogyna TaxID=1202772 RepID=A0A1V9YXF9_ACHHY|nr:hypothetical protein ACHHYP_05468 [Achlya hypogyna]
MEVVEVLNFASARAHELGELHRASGFEESGRATLLKRRKDYHLRRRTNAYNSHKFPVRLRNKKAGGNPNRDRCRKHRRRFMLKVKSNHLPTHGWLVKRMVMEERHGLFVPLHRIDRGISAALDAPATVADVSYLSLLQITGSPEDIDETVGLCIDGELPADVVSGAVEGAVVFYHASCFPLQAIGPVQIMFQPPNEVDAPRRVVWLWVHPSTTDEILHALREAAPSTVTVADCRRELSRFEIRGKQAPRILQQVVEPYSAGTQLFWSPTETAHTVQTWTARDPRQKAGPPPASGVGLLATPTDVDKSKVVCPVSGRDITAPMDRAALAAEPSLEELTQLFASVMAWANNKDGTIKYVDAVPMAASPKKSKLPVAHEYYAEATKTPSPLWSPETRCDVASGFVPDHIVNRKPATKRQLAPLHLLVIRQDHGWDLIVPPAYAPSMLKACVFAGASAIGIDEHDAVQTKHGQLSFPRDYPDTRAGAAFWAKVDADGVARQLALPKAKRVAFDALQTASPHQPAWPALFGASSSDDAAEESNFCVLRGKTYMEPFAFYAPEESAKGGHRPPASRQEIMFWIERVFVPMAMPTLICVQLRVPRRGRLETNAMLCMPTEDDITAYVTNPKWSGVMAPTAKQAKKHQFADRPVVGYVTSAIETKNKSPVLGTGFCHCEALQDLFLPQVADAPLGLVLVRSPTSLQYRPALVSVAP